MKRSLLSWQAEYLVLWPRADLFHSNLWTHVDDIDRIVADNLKVCNATNGYSTMLDEVLFSRSGAQDTKNIPSLSQS